MNKNILLDADGIVIRPRHKFFSEKFSEEHNIPLEFILPFFKREYKKAAIGEVEFCEVRDADHSFRDPETKQPIYENEALRIAFE